MSQCLRTTHSYKSMFCRRVLSWKAPLFLDKTQWPSQVLGKVIRQMPRLWAPSMPEQLDDRTPLRSSSWLWVPGVILISFPDFIASSWRWEALAGALHSCQEPFLGFSSVLFFFLRLCLPHPPLLEQHPGFGHC